MSLEENRRMKQCINFIKTPPPQAKQWLWFVGLWVGSLITFSTGVYLLKAFFSMIFLL